MESRCRPKSEGLSLLEMLITLVILAIGIVAVLESFGYSARMTALSCDIIRAVNLAEDRLQELAFKEGSGKLADIDETGSDSKFNWHYKLALDQDYQSLYRLSFDINWERSKRRELIGIDTYLLK